MEEKKQKNVRTMKRHRGDTHSVWATTLGYVDVCGLYKTGPSPYLIIVEELELGS